VCILGPLLIAGPDGVVPAGGRLQRRVLARLAMDAGRPVAPDDLEEGVWGDDRPRAGRHTIATHVFRLRGLGLDIATRGDAYVLETPTDVDALDRLIAEARAAEERDDVPAAVASAREALALWRGRPLPELDNLPDAGVVRARLEDGVEDLRERLLSQELQIRPAAELTTSARGLVDGHPYRERRWELLMLTLYRAGRQADALDAFAECRRLLLDDLGLDPGPSLRRMQQAILSQDPSLEAPGQVPSPLDRDGRAGTGEASVLATPPRPPRVPGVSTRLIGRAGEQRDLADLWSRARLGTLLGPPGAGKTRLALEVARHDPGPVWYVSLDQIAEPQSVAGAILDVVDPSSDRGRRRARGRCGAAGPRRL